MKHIKQYENNNRKYYIFETDNKISIYFINGGYIEHDVHVTVICILLGANKTGKLSGLITRYDEVLNHTFTDSFLSDRTTYGPATFEECEDRINITLSTDKYNL